MMTPTQSRIAREARACPDCGATIWRGSARCMPCHHAARKAAHERPAPARKADDGGPYVRIVVPKMDAWETHGDGGDPYRHETLTWACASPEQARAMEAVFAERLGDVPSRRAFTPGRGADHADAVRVCAECDVRPARHHATLCAACERAGQRAGARARVLAKIAARVGAEA